METVIEKQPIEKALERYGIYCGDMFIEFFDSVNEQLALSLEQQEKIKEYLKPEALEKRDRLADFFDQMDAQIEKAKRQEKRISDARKHLERLKECVESSVSTQMKEMGLKRINGEQHGFINVKNPASVHVFDEAQLPRWECELCARQGSRFMDTKLIPNKTKIREALDKGEKVPGAELVTDRTHLEVR